MSVDFVGESESHEHYCVNGSHMFDLNIHDEPEQLIKTAEVFEAWAKFVREVAEIHAI